MFHFIKFLILSVFLFLVLNLFRSNLDIAVSLKFDVPMVYEWASIPISVNYLLLISFCVGIIFAAFAGAFRMGQLKSQTKEVKQLRKALQDVEKKPEETVSPTDPFPPLASR